MLLRDSEHKGELQYAQVEELARGALGPDPEGYRAEFARLVGLAEIRLHSAITDTCRPRGLQFGNSSLCRVADATHSRRGS